MYTVDGKDCVIALDDVPQSSIGAPCPMLLVGEHHLHLAYYMQDAPEGWNGKSVRVIDENTFNEPVALVEFVHPYAHMFGPPNDEAFAGHPLASRGLEPYGVFEIRDSSWIRQFERMNSVHPYHRAESFSKYRHYVFAFHDRTFECVAEDFKISVHTGSVASILQTTFQVD